MDRVRFGRALGFGTRQALKTLVAAADAATSENPSVSKGATSSRPAVPEPQLQRPIQMPTQVRTPTPAPAPRAQAATKRAAQVKEIPQGLRRGTKRFGEAMWGPVVRLSGVLWLEVTGVFFGIFALFALGTVWRLRGEWHSTATNAASHRNLLGAVLMLVVFGYFCVTSFIRAHKRERGR
jgi:hypothetical protein